MCKRLIVLLLVLSIASIASADAWFKPSQNGTDSLYPGGDWTDWSDSANWEVAGEGYGSRIPNSGDCLWIDGDWSWNLYYDSATMRAEIRTGLDAECKQLWAGNQHDWQLPVDTEIVVEAGGSLSQVGTDDWGNGLACRINLDGETIGGASLILNGGSTEWANMTIKREGEYATYATTRGSATLDINASGTAHLHAFTMLPYGGTVDIEVGGTLILDGKWDVDDPDHNLMALIANGDVIACGGSGTVVVSYSFAAGETTVTAIPEPATIALLGLGGLALIRRKR